MGTCDAFVDVNSFNKVKEESEKLAAENDELNKTIKTMQDEIQEIKTEKDETFRTDQKTTEEYNTLLEAHNKINEDFLKLTSEKEELSKTIQTMQDDQGETSEKQ